MKDDRNLYNVVSLCKSIQNNRKKIKDMFSSSFPTQFDCDFILIRDIVIHGN